MTNPKCSPFGSSVTDGFSPVSNVAEVRATARLDQHILGLGAQGEAPIKRHAIRLIKKSRFRQILEHCFQHSPQQRTLGEPARRNVP
jgi:hypothetical protein